MTPALIVAAPRSGSGKTTVTIALVAALRARGLTVRVAKSGPDYIDPAFHERASGAPCLNLDSWAMPAALLAALLHDTARDADLVVIEASMGLFDGAGDTPLRRGSASDLAARFAIPVLLTLDVSGQSQSAAATATGFARFDPRVQVAGVILNRVGSERHRAGAAQAIAARGLAVLGSLPRDPALALPERHLGLVQASEHDRLDHRLATLAELAAFRFDLDAILACARPPTASAEPHAASAALTPPGQRIALAWDTAFSFAYPHLLSGWHAAGSEIAPFSPLADQQPPEHCDCCWLPGGYPELHAARLAAASRFHAGLARFAATRPVHGECGGYMVLGQGLEDAAGQRHAMAGLLAHDSSYARRRMHLGYREATLLADTPIGRRASVLRGHEFHYATVSGEDDAPLATLTDAAGAELGPAGGQRGHVSGSFFHVIAAQEP